jgi:hypothetical protein
VRTAYGRGKGRFARAFSIGAVLLDAADLADRSGTLYQKRTLYSFCLNGGDCADGTSPQSGLIIHQPGNLYGATSEGGNPNDSGVVYPRWLFPNGWRTGSVTTHVLTRTFAEAVKAANPPGGRSATPHRLRHPYATRLDRG